MAICLDFYSLSQVAVLLFFTLYHFASDSCPTFCLLASSSCPFDFFLFVSDSCSTCFFLFVSWPKLASSLPRFFSICLLAPSVSCPFGVFSICLFASGSCPSGFLSWPQACVRFLFSCCCPSGFLLFVFLTKEAVFLDFFLFVLTLGSCPSQFLLCVTLPFWIFTLCFFTSG